MGVSPKIISTHIETLGASNRPHRRNWPSRVFHHAPVENAALILSSGQLLSRNDSAKVRKVDIAPLDIINNRIEAHKYVRTYFRPKTPTQYHIEGISKPGELYQGRHAPVLVIFVFDLQKLLLQKGVQFSDGNMQSPATTFGDSDDFFSTIRFDLVYHEGPFEQGSDVLRCRCAEVLAPSPLLLDNTLQAVLCRSAAERETLLHMAGAAASKWADRVRVNSETGLFEGRRTYVETFDVSDEGVIFKLHPRQDGADVEVQLRVFALGGQQLVNYGPKVLSTSKRWQFKYNFDPGEYLAEVFLEGCLAYQAKFLVSDLPF